MTTQLGKYVLGIYFRKPFQKIGKSWEFVLSCKVTKSYNTVNKGRAAVNAYVIDIPFISIIVQDIKKRISLVKNI